MLFDPGAVPAHAVTGADVVSDLHLDRIREAVLAGYAGFGLEPVFEATLADAGAVTYRHEVFRDLARTEIGAAFTAFTQRMRQMRDCLDRARIPHDDRQRDRWHLDAAHAYSRAVTDLHAALLTARPSSRALTALAGYLSDYVAAEAFTRLSTEADAIATELAADRYYIHTDGRRVRLERYGGQPDLSAEVTDAFARFAAASAPAPPVDIAPSRDLNHIEERVLDGVARLSPGLFRRLAEFHTAHADFVDPGVLSCHREIQFYRAYATFADRFTAAGLSFCYPQVSSGPAGVFADGAFDTALADTLIEEREPVVCNNFRLSGAERILVVTGPNNGGKTTFARMFGQLAYLAALGCPVPGTRARLPLPDRVFTHFERREHLATLHGKLDGELLRIRDTLTAATSSSVIVMNESFSSTTAADAAQIGADVLTEIGKRGAIAVFVTFLDELASLNETTVSMVGEMSPADPGARTYRFARRPADGLAYAEAIAAKYDLTHDAVRRAVSA